MKVSKRRLWLFGAIALGAIILITLLAAPANNKLNSGSSYGRAPDGYGAWYAFMSERGTPVQRWRKPFEALATDKNVKPPITLVRVYSKLTGPWLDQKEQTFAGELLSGIERDWVKSGNTLVILGVWQPVTEAPFSTMHKVEAGSVKIETARRDKVTKEPILGDRFGAIVWEEKIGKGRVVFATTPYLAANAYQDFRSNYEFLAQMVTQNSQTVWVDEYIHGYKDPEVIKSEKGWRQGKKQDIFSYLANTPLFPAFLQGFVLLLIAIWAGNRRFGKPLTLPAPVVNNSEAYIQALGGVLQKANSSEFILEIVGKEERLQLQKALLLGEVPLDDRSLVDAWVRQTGRPATELEPLLQIQSRKRRMSELNLLSWLGKWEEIRRNLPYYSEKSQEREPGRG
jgi:hypothetical protein